ncbi:unnamed protein product [Lactuca saligna]|uniref:Uncharacterized protein n=1 Tax=Lactuca saligna TaxID=75948 RepID=A0AA35ZEL2_LACSI|nr:unnamed protein product [Lactuca saligna]
MAIYIDVRVYFQGIFERYPIHYTNGTNQRLGDIDFAAMEKECYAFMERFTGEKWHTDDNGPDFEMGEYVSECEHVDADMGKLKMTWGTIKMMRMMLLLICQIGSMKSNLGRSSIMC